MSKSEIIIGISEAHSMQPHHWTVAGQGRRGSIIVSGIEYQDESDQCGERNPEKDRILSEVKWEHFTPSPNTPIVGVYVGYDQHGRKCMQWIDSSVNVTFA